MFLRFSAFKFINEKSITRLKKTLSSIQDIYGDKHHLVGILKYELGKLIFLNEKNIEESINCFNESFDILSENQHSFVIKPYISLKEMFKMKGEKFNLKNNYGKYENQSSHFPEFDKSTILSRLHGMPIQTIL